jgi:hypothetical protein
MWWNETTDDRFIRQSRIKTLRDFARKYKAVRNGPSVRAFKAKGLKKLLEKEGLSG